MFSTYLLVTLLSSLLIPLVLTFLLFVALILLLLAGPELFLGGA